MEIHKTWGGGNSTGGSLGGYTVSEDGTWELTTADGFKAFVNHINTVDSSANAKLTTDIVLSSTNPKILSKSASSDTWTPIAIYSGTFDGNGHSISGVSINKPDASYVGMFGLISKSGIVKNLIILNANIVGKNYVGLIAGENHGTITNVNVDKLILTASDYVAGIVGKNKGYITLVNVDNSKITSTKSTDMTASSETGGIVAVHDSGVITAANVRNTELNSAGEYGSVGGVVGESYSLISASYSENIVITGGREVGAIVGDGDNGKLKTNYFVNTDASMYGNGSHISGGMGMPGPSNDNSTKVVAMTESEITTLNNILKYFSHEYVLDGGKAIVKQKATLPTLSGVTIDDKGTYLVSNAEGLGIIRDYINNINPSINIKLTENITLDSSVEWEAIGNSYSIEYGGIFDGNGYTISGLTFTASSQTLKSLFGYIGEIGVVKNLGVINTSGISDVIYDNYGLSTAVYTDSTTYTEVELVEENNALKYNTHEYVLENGNLSLKLKAIQPTMAGVTVDKYGVYLVSNAEGLHAIRDYINTINSSISVRLVDNITLDNTVLWIPIEKYSGVFDGNGYTINGLSVDSSIISSSSAYQPVNVGFIGLLTPVGVIKKLGIVEASVSASSSSPGMGSYSNVGGIVGENNGMIIASYVDNAEIDGSGIAGESDWGVVVGSYVKNARITGDGIVSARNNSSVMASYTSGVIGNPSYGYGIAGNSLSIVDTNFFVSDDETKFGVSVGYMGGGTNDNATRLTTVKELNNNVDVINTAMKNYIIASGYEYKKGTDEDVDNPKIVKIAQ